MSSDGVIRTYEKSARALEPVEIAIRNWKIPSGTERYRIQHLLVSTRYSTLAVTVVISGTLINVVAALVTLAATFDVEAFTMTTDV